MKSEPGTYVLILQSRLSAQLQIGRWGQIDIDKGYYIYVGSAFGPGGVRARVLRHCRKKKKHHWHIDYLSVVLNPWCAWYSHDKNRLEHLWADVFVDMPDMISIPGFGCTDCKCSSHLFYSATTPDFTPFSSIAGAAVESCDLTDH